MSFLCCKYRISQLRVGVLIASSLLAVACGSESTKKFKNVANGGSPAAPTPVPTPSTANYSVEISAPTPTSLITKSSADIGDANCTNEFSVTVKDSGVAAANAPVTLAIVAGSGVTDTGTVSPATGVTDASGIMKGRYCAGDVETTVAITAKVYDKQANTGAISSTKRLQYGFTYEGTEDLAENVGFVDEFLGFLADTDAPSAKEILLNLFGSGKDRINLLFKAVGGGGAYAGASGTFVSQADYPMGAKLGLCSAAATTAADPVTGRAYLTYTTTSNASGIFKVPVCAARMPGNLMVKGTTVLGTGTSMKTFTAEAAAVRFEGGLANYGNISITFDSTNAKVLATSFATNTEGLLKFKARLQSRLDGDLSTNNPLGVFTEYGKVNIGGGGKPGTDGAVEFSVEGLNNRANRPLRVTKYDISNGIDYDHMCTPSQFTTTTQFSSLAKDWRSTVLYYVKGQEQFFDANYDGQYTAANSVGFWDRNQNGVFDCTVRSMVGSDTRICDQITYKDPSATNANIASIAIGAYPMGAPTALCAATSCLSTAQQQAIYQYDWFVDMPTPYVDSDENGDHRNAAGAQQLAEYVVGEAFQLPNGKWDRENYVWKSFVMPVFVGTSPYSLTHRVIDSNTNTVFSTIAAGGVKDTDELVAATDPTAGLASFMRVSGYRTSLWDQTSDDSTGASGVRETLFGCHNCSNLKI